MINKAHNYSDSYKADTKYILKINNTEEGSNMSPEQVKIESMEEDTENKVKNWSTWSLNKTVLIGIIVNILICFVGLTIIFRNGLSGFFENARLPDNIYWEMLTTAIQILVVSKYKGSIGAKIGTFILILILSYLISGIIFYFLPLIIVSVMTNH